MNVKRLYAGDLHSVDPGFLTQPFLIRHLSFFISVARRTRISTHAKQHTVSLFCVF